MPPRPTGSHRLLPLLSRFSGMRPTGLPGCQPTAWAIFWHTHDNSLLHSSITLAHSKSPSSASLSLMICCRMICSTPMFSLKLSSQSKWRHPIANAPKNYVSTFIYRITNVPYPWLVMGYSPHRRQYWVGSTFMMLCTTSCCVERRACGVTALCRAIHQNVENTTQIICAMKLTRRPTVLLNVACDSQNISSTWRYILREAVQTYDVEMTCQRFIYNWGPAIAPPRDKPAKGALFMSRGAKST